MKLRNQYLGYCSLVLNYLTPEQIHRCKKKPSMEKAIHQLLSEEQREILKYLYIEFAFLKVLQHLKYISEQQLQQLVKEKVSSSEDCREQMFNFLQEPFVAPEDLPKIINTIHQQKVFEEEETQILHKTLSPYLQDAGKKTATLPQMIKDEEEKEDN